MDLEKYIDELQTLVNVDCGTQTVAGVAQVAAVMRELWLQEGWNTEQIDLGSAVGPALLATNKPYATQYDVLLIGHLDTVFPAGTVAERPMSRDESRLYGPGVSDMKSGLLNIVWAMRTLPAEHLERLSIAVAMNPDEETGSVHSSEWIGELAKRAACWSAKPPGQTVRW